MSTLPLLVALLGSPDYPTREAAECLLRAGRPLTDGWLERGLASGNAEVEFRSRRALRGGWVTTAGAYFTGRHLVYGDLDGGRYDLPYPTPAIQDRYGGDIEVRRAVMWVANLDPRWVDIAGRRAIVCLDPDRFKDPLQYVQLEGLSEIRFAVRGLGARHYWCTLTRVKEIRRRGLFWYAAEWETYQPDADEAKRLWAVTRTTWRPMTVVVPDEMPARKK